MPKSILMRWQQQRPSPKADVDNQWQHDRAPTGPAKMRNATIRAPIAPAAALNNKLVVSNLHYEITPKDLIVRFPSFSNISLLIIKIQSIFGQIGTLIREPLLRVRHATELPLRKNQSQPCDLLSLPSPISAR